ncbi:MAG: universal stress protein [Candidatus Binataceae bacterium]
MPIFEHILCPVDFDDNSLTALRLASLLAERDKATLFLMHVIRIVEEMIVAAPVALSQDERLTHSQLDKLAENHLGSINHQIIVRYGNPAEQILAAELELGVDLVVMATHGRTGISHLFFGSVAEKVVRESSCPVLTVRRGVSQPKQA